MPLFKCFDEQKKEISAKKAEVGTVVNREIDTVIQKVEYRRTQLLACLKQDTNSVMRKLAHEKYQVEEVQKMFNLSLYTAISSLVPRRDPGHEAMQLVASQITSTADAAYES